MAVFRVDRKKDYTVMSNIHFKDKRLSLKAKGLLSLALSLPPEWDYTLRGLTTLGTDGIDSIRKAVNELEKTGYIVRSRERNDTGQFKGTEYVIHEEPISEIPTLETPTLENPMQLNTKVLNTQKETTLSENTHSFFPSAPSADRQTERLREKIREQIEYKFVCTQTNRAQIDEFVEIMLEVTMTQGPTIKIGRDAVYPTGFVQERFSKITSEHIQKVLDGIGENTTRVWNTKAYLLAALFNAPSSIDNHYTMLVNHDFHDGSK